jgi:flagellar biosynthesis/type III secretory pathway protein FliH
MNTAKNEGIAEGRAEGRAEGLAEGEAIGMEKGRAEGRMEGELAMLTKLVLANKEKGKTSSEIAEMLDVDINLVDDILNGKR